MRCRTPDAVVLVGERPNTRLWTGRQRDVFTGPWFERFAGLCGLDYPYEYMTFFHRVNLIEEPSHDELDLARSSDLVKVADGRAMILLGRRVHRGFCRGWEREPFLSRQECLGPLGRGTSCYLLPHPSGRCRWWNSPQRRGRAALLLRRVCASARAESLDRVESARSG